MPHWLDQLQHIIAPWLPLLVVASVCALVISLILIPAIIIILPTDFFAREKKPDYKHPVLATTIYCVRNLLALCLLIVGLLMLLLPGQGLLTVLFAIILADFPGKIRLERRILDHPLSMKSMNWLRRKANKPDFLPHNLR